MKVFDKIIGRKTPPKFDKGDLEFGAEALDVARRYYKGSFDGDEGEAFLQELYAEFRAQGGKVVTKEMRAWLRKRLTSVFLCVDKVPKWLDEPEWPYLAGRPMIFLGQMTVPRNTLTEELASPGDEVFVFTARRFEPGTENWEIEYVTVSQDRELAGATLIVED